MGKKGREVDPDIIGQVYEFDEDGLALVIGLKRHIIQEARESIKERAGWTLMKGSVVYSREGVVQLLAALGMKQSEAWVEELLKQSRTGTAWENGRHEFRRARVSVLTLNKRIVLAQLMDHPDCMTVRVIVGDNSLYAPGVEMSVRPVSLPDLYEITGSKPKVKGGWGS